MTGLHLAMWVWAPAAGIEWRLRAGDPTFLGWLITAGYLVSAWLAVRAARQANAAGEGRKLVVFW